MADGGPVATDSAAITAASPPVPTAPQAVYEESLHYVHLHPTRPPPPGPSSSSPDPLVAYPPPPSPPHSDTSDNYQEDEVEFHSACFNFIDTLRAENQPAHSSASAPSLTISSLSPQATANPTATSTTASTSERNAVRPHLASPSDSEAKPPVAPRRPDIDDAATVATLATSATTATAATTGTAETHQSRSSRESSKRHRAKMAAKAASKPLRRSYVGMVAGLASTVGLGQAMFLKATYQSPPDARGPRSGVERPHTAKHLSSAQGHVARIVTSPQDDASAPPVSPTPASRTVEAAVKEAVKEAVSVAAVSNSGNVGLSGDGITTGRKRILIIGDSLVSGVGGESSFDDGPSTGPALPRQVARYLSEMLKMDVQWNALSLTGGDVRMLKRKIVPMMMRERDRGNFDDIWAVVIVTGVNDWKRISPIRTANKFREDLCEFVVKIREVLGEDCNVFLPAIPGVHHTPRFHEPLRSIVIFLNDYWDSQKWQLSRTMERVYFVGQPPSNAWGSNPLQFFSTLDRVHPSELGYHRWAERIAENMTAAFKKSIRQGADAVGGAPMNVVAAAVGNEEQVTTKSNVDSDAKANGKTALDETKRSEEDEPGSSAPVLAEMRSLSVSRVD